jgi:hypothetical protein
MPLGLLCKTKKRKKERAPKERKSTRVQKADKKEQTTNERTNERHVHPAAGLHALRNEHQRNHNKPT